MLHLRIALVLAALVYLACGSTFELDLSRKSGHGARPSAKRNGRNKQRSTVDESDLYFVTDVAVGTPPQRFSVALRLDTAAFSVPDKSCIYLPDCPSYCKAALFCKALCPSLCCDAASQPPPQPEYICIYANLDSDCDNLRKFDRSKSSTYQSCTDCSWGCDQGYVSEEFFQGIDTIRINDGNGKELAIQNATFGEIYRMDTDQTMSLFDGVYGIGVSNHSIPADYTPPIITAHKQGLIADPIVTLWANRSVVAENVKANTTVPSVGKLTVGGLNAQQCGTVAEWHPIQPDLYVGDTDGGVYDQDIRLVLKQVCLGSTCVDVQDDMDADSTVIDMITNGDRDIIWATDESLNPIAKAAGATMDEKTNAYRIACDATISPLRFQFGNTEYLVQPKDFIRKWDGLDYCSLRLGTLVGDAPEVSLLPSHCYSIDLDKKLMTFAPNLVA